MSTHNIGFYGELSNTLLICSAAFQTRSVRVAKQKVLPTSDHRVLGSDSADENILSDPKWHFSAQSPSCSAFHHPDMTEILLKGREAPNHQMYLLILGFS